MEKPFGKKIGLEVDGRKIICRVKDGELTSLNPKHKSEFEKINPR